MPFARNGDVMIWYEAFGDPADPALLLVNGLGSQCINYREEWCAKFAAEGFFVVRFDNRDVGLSTKFDGVEAVPAADGPPYTVSDMAADALAVLDDLGVGRAHVMGLSMGGMIVQTLAIEHPERLLSMTSVMSTTGDPDVGNPTPEAMAALTAPPPADRDGYIAAHVARIGVYGTPGSYEPGYLEKVAGESYDRCFHPQGTGRQMLAIVAGGSRTAALRAVTVPTLVMHGDADRLVDISGGRRTAEAVPGARFEVLEGMGHDYPPAYWDRWVELVAAHAHGVTSRPA